MIAIPNMDMPEHCYECLLRQGNCCLLLYEATPPTVPLTRLDDCPIIDIVRCGECKWCDDKGKGRALICTNPYIDMDIHPLDFCSYGERRSE